MNTAYLGTSAFAGAVLRRLNDSPHRPSLVISRPDSPSGRGRRLTPPPAAQIAAQLGIELYQPESVNGDEARARIADAQPQLLIVCAFGALIKEPLLSDFPILNVHPSLLPRWRGAAPIERAILAGDTESGVSIMRLTAGLDTGPVCLQQKLAIEAEDDYGTLAAKLETLGADLLLEALDAQDRGELDQLFTDQDESAVSYAEKLTPQDRLLDPARPAGELALRVRALSPHIGAYVELDDGGRLGVWRAAHVATLADESTRTDVASRVDETTRLGVHAGRLYLHTGDGLLELLEVQPAGRKRMQAGDYVRGLKA